MTSKFSKHNFYYVMLEHDIITKYQNLLINVFRLEVVMLRTASTMHSCITRLVCRMTRFCNFLGYAV